MTDSTIPFPSAHARSIMEDIVDLVRPPRTPQVSAEQFARACKKFAAQAERTAGMLVPAPSYGELLVQVAELRRTLCAIGLAAEGLAELTAPHNDTARMIAHLAKEAVR